MRTTIAALFLFIFASRAWAQEEARLLRFPAINGDRLVFSYAGDLYTVSAQGGIARRLTSHEGYEMFARFSPDGKSLAFTGQYDGNTEVYVMPAEGGVPKRLTFTATLDRDDVSDRMGPNNIVMGWKGNDEIIFRSRMIEPNDFNGQLFLMPAKGANGQQNKVTGHVSGNHIELVRHLGGTLQGKEQYYHGNYNANGSAAAGTITGVGGPGDWVAAIVVQ